MKRLALTKPRVEETSASAAADGRHDFDFLIGRWRITNHKMENPLAPVATDWLTFEATNETRPILDGLGNFDLYESPDFPGRPGFHAFALRLFDSETREWRIWWASTVGRGQLDPPVVGRFAGGLGQFECDDVLGSRAVRVRFEWTDITSSSARWAQSFSFDGGQSYMTNWIMEWARTA